MYLDIVLWLIHVVFARKLVERYVTNGHGVASRHVCAAAGISDGEAPDTLPAAVAIIVQRCDCQAHTVVRVAVDDVHAHVEGRHVEDPAVSIHTKAERDMRSVSAQEGL